MRLMLNTATAELECDVMYTRAGGSSEPSSSTATGVAAVVLHPWGRLGGSMHDPTVMAQFHAAARSGLCDVVVRYNQRCAGSSRGKARLSSDPDADDLVALCTHILSNQLPGGWDGPPPQRIVFICYSYGSCVAALALARVPQVVAYVTIGFPLGALSRWFLGSGSAWSALAASAVPKLLIMGDADNFTSLSQLREATAKHDATPGAGPLDTRIIRGADHFFMDLWNEVAAYVQVWLARKLKAVAVVGPGAELVSSQQQQLLQQQQ